MPLQFRLCLISSAQVGSTAQELASEDMLDKDIRYLGKQGNKCPSYPIPRPAKTRELGSRRARKFFTLITLILVGQQACSNRWFWGLIVTDKPSFNRMPVPYYSKGTFRPFLLRIILLPSRVTGTLPARALPSRNRSSPHPKALFYGINFLTIQIETVGIQSQ